MEPDPAIAGAGPSIRYRWSGAVTLAAAACSIALGLHLAGASRRVVAGPGVPWRRAPCVLAGSNREVVTAWHERGVRGRLVVHAGRFLHFVEDGTLSRRTLSGPGDGPAADAALLAASGPRNHLWVAAELGVSRRTWFVSPPASLGDRLASLGRGEAELPLAIAAQTHPRVLDRRPPEVAEPVLLEVNASWFDEGDGDSLARALDASGVRTDLVAISLAEDSVDVSPGARDRARAFGGIADGSRGCAR
jgi:hypothetical protein